MATRFLKISSNGNRFLKISSNGSKILRSRLMTAPSYMIIFHFSFLFSTEVIRGVGKSSAMAQSSLLATFRVNENTANTIIKGEPSFHSTFYTVVTL